MQEILRCRLVLLVGLSVLCGSANCIGRDPGPQQLVSPELLKAGNLEIAWWNELPIRKDDNLEKLFILSDRIYAFSDRNYIVSLDRDTGDTIFSRPFTQPGFPVLGLELYEDELLSIVGNRLIETNVEFGTQRGVTHLGFNATCPAARNNSYFYVAGADRRLHILRAEDKVQVFEAAAENDSMITSIVAGERFVVFGTDAGNVISITVGKPERLWSFGAADSIVGPIVREKNALFFASKDTNVYKLNILTGKLVWKYQTGAVLENSPVVSEGVVYQYVRGKGLAAIDRKSGKGMWQLAKGADLLAEADGKAYVITSVGTLVVMDNKKAKQLYSINFAQVSRYVANVADSKIYIADRAGRIACLKPIK